MIKSELVEKLAEEFPHLRRGDITKVVECILGTVTDALENGDRVELRGFGSFAVKHRTARKARNPRSGGTVDVPDKNFVQFRAGKEIRHALINSGKRK